MLQEKTAVDKDVAALTVRDQDKPSEKKEDGHDHSPSSHKCCPGPTHGHSQPHPRHVKDETPSRCPRTTLEGKKDTGYEGS